MGLWDILLLISVPAMGTSAAYLHAPRLKALVLFVPIPFTIATLAVGTNVDVTHMFGALTLLGFWFCVYGLRHRARLPIIPSIVLGATAFCAVGMLLKRVLPRTETWFWIACAVVVLVGVTLNARLHYRVEPGHGTRMPVWIKLPLLSAVVLILIAIKPLLGGFMTTFPMMGVLVAYESRYSLWTTCRQVPLLILCMAPMFVTIHLATPHLGIYLGLGLGWITMGIVTTAMLRYYWPREWSSCRP